LSPRGDFRGVTDTINKRTNKIILDKIVPLRGL